MFHASLERYFRRPRPGLPYTSPAEYGARLAAIVVKHRGEMDAAAALGAPVAVIPNGVPLGPSPGPRGRREVLSIGTAARISPGKRLEDLLDALRAAAPRLPPHVLRIAGEPDRDSACYPALLRRLSRGLRVEFAGHAGDIRAFLDGLDVFAMISEPPGCPNASLEAMAAGLPVIATDVGGAREQVDDGVTGRLVPPRDPAAFASALVELCSDADLRARMGAAARERAARLFDVRRMAGDYRRLCFSNET
jgi:glycosyltransferase involved in cell wall biosynthesis